MGEVMSFLGGGPGAPDLSCCAYGTSRLVFRGPPRALNGVYVAALGGAATFGKGVARPWPQLLEAALGRPVVNFGAVGAGPDAFLRDDTVLAACGAAAVTVVQITGAAALSNPYYRVHPRRNDRFVQALPPLRALYPEVDFCEFSFVGHLLGALHRRDPLRFGRLATALQTAWVERMAGLLARLPGPAVLLWLGTRTPADDAPLGTGPGPLLVSRPMLATLRPCAARLVEVVAPAPRSGPRGLHGPQAHEAAAAALAPQLAGMLGPLPAAPLPAAPLPLRRATG